MTEPRSYAAGGYIPTPVGAPPVVVMRLDPDECLISAEDVRNHRLLCSRAGHPTATSDCTTEAWIRHRERPTAA